MLQSPEHISSYIADEEAGVILESVTDPVFALDSQWCLTYLNGSAERLSGVRREDSLEKNVWDVYPATVGSTVQRELLRAATDRVSVAVEGYHTPSRRYFRLKSYPTGTGGLSVFCQDITERKRTDARTQLLTRLDDELLRSTSVCDIARCAVQLLGEHLNADRVIYAELSGQDGDLAVLGEYSPTLPSISGQYSLADLSERGCAAVLSGQSFNDVDVQSGDFDHTERDRFAAIGMRAVLTVPIRQRSRLGALIAVHRAEPTESWDADQELTEIVGRRCAEFIERARVAHELEANERQFRAFVTTTSDAVYRMNAVTSITTRPFAFETAGLLNQASEPHPASSRFTWIELINFPDIYPRFFAEESTTLTEGRTERS